MFEWIDRWRCQNTGAQSVTLKRLWVIATVQVVRGTISLRKYRISPTLIGVCGVVASIDNTWTLTEDRYGARARRETESAVREGPHAPVGSNRPSTPTFRRCHRFRRARTRWARGP